MKKLMKLKIFQIIIILIVLLLCEQVALSKAHTKATNTSLNKTLDLQAMAIKIEEFRLNDLNTILETYRGELTAYVAHCPLCSGRLGCTGKDVRDGTTTYIDDDFGTVRIIASSRSLPCGSIVRFNLPSVSDRPITAIVLDRGVLGTDIDLLMDSEQDALRKVGRKQISYDILRFGYDW